MRTILSNGHGLFSRLTPSQLPDALKPLQESHKVDIKISFTNDSINISDFHCLISKEGESFFLTPLSSVKMNDKLLQMNQKHQIKNLDRIEFVTVLTSKQLIEDNKQVFPHLYHVIFADEKMKKEMQ